MWIAQVPPKDLLKNNEIKFKIHSKKMIFIIYLCDLSSLKFQIVSLNTFFSNLM